MPSNSIVSTISKAAQQVSIAAAVKSAVGAVERYGTGNSPSGPAPKPPVVQFETAISWQKRLAGDNHVRREEPRAHSFVPREQVSQKYEYAITNPRGPHGDMPILARAPLFAKGAGDVDEVAMNDVKQGAIGNCYLMATLGAVAHQDPQAIKNMIRENRDGTYTVTFKERLPFSNPPAYNDRKITVTPDFPGGIGSNQHAGPGDLDSKGHREIWPLVIEKAYAQYIAGGYAEMDRGNKPHYMMELITGRPAVADPDPEDFSGIGVGKPIGQYGASKLSFDDIDNDLRNGKAVVLGTSSLVGTSMYGLRGKHAYTVEAAYTDANGQQWLKLYNPWGNNHPAPIPYEAVKDSSLLTMYIS